MALTTFDSSQNSAFLNTFVGVGRNRILNGEIRIDQANGGSATAGIAASGVYGPDGFRGDGTAAAGVFTMQRSTSTPPTGFAYFMRMNCTTADASLAASDRYIFRQFIEGNFVRDFLLGTANAKAFTFSFWARSSLTGTYCVSFLNSAGDRNYIKEYSISVANTWEFKTITLTGDVTGTWLTDTGNGLTIAWTLAVGSTFQGTASTWQAGLLYATSNQVNFMSSNSSRTLDITGVQLEIGSAATAFEYRLFPVDVMLCQRYFEKNYDLDTVAGASTSTGEINLSSGQTNTNERTTGSYAFKVQKRITPTITYYTESGTSGSWLWESTAAAFNARTVTSVYLNSMGFSLKQTNNSTEQVGLGFYTADARF